MLVYLPTAADYSLVSWHGIPPTGNFCTLVSYINIDVDLDVSADLSVDISVEVEIDVSL